ncbi:hypothetical protein G6O69_31645 [Pseudenhygromyxa sp. WMMC2535]|uniref:hypothetical protein n=1 Tax=Pseudenhygromyxa sp. WMMC2535 TaxID=2712867 RepID=UPI001555008C|nr:hypothetical protein [Pseudenhygromyxa sp. WMMC2535]NVB42420.1 hypothetical protein [Pseudenhygromyxa sp. WMMC2535]
MTKSTKPTKPTKPLLLPLCAALLLLPSAALAAPSPDSGSQTWVDSDEGATVTQHANGVREIVIDDGDTIDGETLSPNGAIVRGPLATIHASMITIRPHFMDALSSVSRDI